MEHPYVPRDLQLPGFVPNSLPASTIIGVYALVSLLVVSLICILSGRFRKVSTLDRFLMCWWAFTGLTHIVHEGYFVFSPEFYKDDTSFYLAEAWKEYCKGDSRYAARDSAVVAVEVITAVLEGPACLLAVYAIAKAKSYSHILQFSISLGQLYGTIVYFVTSVLDGDNFAASAYHYYAYYVFANSFWILIPSLIALRSWKTVVVACKGVDQNQKKKVR